MNNKQASVAGSAVAEAPRQDMPWDHPRFRNWIAVGRLHAHWERAFARELKPLGIKCAHHDVLANVRRDPGLTQQVLARRMLVGRSNVTMLLPQLERMSLIRREDDPADRRAKRLFLTPAGESVTAASLAVQLRLMGRMMEALSLAECDQMGEMARRLTETLAEGKPTPRPAPQAAP